MEGSKLWTRKEPASTSLDIMWQRLERVISVVSDVLVKLK
ncbi:uncharacterized protein G2W53_017587 [Senna tora]|uniref:Uncharacterized protein n=1 Tax=Senna tora TaxID=362788 RepID=A0A834TPH7_9FABA|nr:uncharacterized protein G2W53_017587 [Senna tora]